VQGQNDRCRASWKMKSNKRQSCWQQQCLIVCGLECRDCRYLVNCVHMWPAAYEGQQKSFKFSHRFGSAFVLKISCLDEKRRTSKQCLAVIIHVGSKLWEKIAGSDKLAFLRHTRFTLQNINHFVLIYKTHHHYSYNFCIKKQDGIIATSTHSLFLFE